MKLYADSTARRVGPLNCLVVQGSTVCLRNGNMYLCECVYGLPLWLSGKEPACQCRRLKRPGLIPGSGRSPGARHDNPF